MVARRYTQRELVEMALDAMTAGADPERHVTLYEIRDWILEFDGRMCSDAAISARWREIRQDRDGERQRRTGTDSHEYRLEPKTEPKRDTLFPLGQTVEQMKRGRA